MKFKSFIPHPSSLRPLTAFILLILATFAASAQTVRITEKPDRLVSGMLDVPIAATEPVERIVLFINSVKYSEAQGRAARVQVNVGQYIRRLRIRAVGYDAQGNVAGEDEMVVNDPRPPFRVRLQTPREAPESGAMTMSANLIKPSDLAVSSVEFFIGEQKVGSSTVPPYAVSVDVNAAPKSVYARVVARSANGEEANDVVFFGETPRDQIDVTVQQIPVSVAEGGKPLRVEDLSLVDNGQPRKIESLVAAADQPLSVILLIDYSESMLEELPVVKAAARQFAQTLLRPQDRIAVVGFNQRTFWLTGFTNDFAAAAASVDRVKPIGQTHLYDSAIEMLYELQKRPGRRALVILTDAVDQGSSFKLDHLVHYAKYAGVPVYPIVKNKTLTRLMRFGVGYLQARRVMSIARETGATYFIIKEERELPAVYERIARDLKQQYQLIFYSDPSATDQWHTLLVESRGGQQLRVPRGYFP